MTGLALLCGEHAEFERSDAQGPDPGELTRALFSPPPRLRAWVACDSGDQLIGYATATIDYSTWHARDFMHLDCLFVRASVRGNGIGRQLLGAVCEAARALGIHEVQWQTPHWNVRAQRFYQRMGATALSKVRFTLSL